MKPPELLRLLGEFFDDKAAVRDRHVATARAVGQYDFNNACQYVIAREDQHLAWVGDAIREMGGSAADVPSPPSLAAATTLEAQSRLMLEDARALEEFERRWRGRVGAVSNAKTRLLLELILGEMREHARVFQQAAGGRLDLLGRRTGGARTEGQVLPTRWVE